MIPVKGNPNLYRDPDSGAIINVSKDQLKQARIAKESVRSSKKRVDVLTERINSIEDKMDRIVKLLENVVKED